MPLPLDLAIDPAILLALACVAFLAGFIDAIAGGGGLLTVPALLTAGLPPHLVLGTNKLSSTFGAATASYTFYRRKLFDPRQWRNGLVATLIGALIGAIVAHWLPAEWLNKMLPVVVFGCGLYLLFGKTPDAPLNADAPIPRRRQWPQGLGLGFYDGVAGPGTGAFWTVSSLLMYPLDLVRASGVADEVHRLRPGAMGTGAVHGRLADGRRLPGRPHGDPWRFALHPPGIHLRGAGAHRAAGLAALARHGLSLQPAGGSISSSGTRRPAISCSSTSRITAASSGTRYQAPGG